MFVFLKRAFILLPTLSFDQRTSFFFSLLVVVLGWHPTVSACQ